MHRAKPSWLASCIIGGITGSHLTATVYNVDYSPVSEEKYKKRETTAEIRGISGTLKLIEQHGGMTDEEISAKVKENYKKFEEDGKKWDSRELKDKFTDTDTIYGYIVSMFTNKAAQFDDYVEERNKAQDAGLTEKSKSAEDNFKLPDGWIKEEGESGRFYNENLDLYSYRHPSIKVPQKWKSSVKEILGKKYVVFKHKHGFESKFLEKDPELPRILQLELKSMQQSEENKETDYEMLRLKENLRADEKDEDYTKNSKLPRGWKTVLDSKSPTGVSYMCDKGANSAQILLTEHGSLFPSDTKIKAYRNPSWPIPDGWIQKSKKLSSSDFIIYYEHERAGLTSFSIETDENIPKELYKSNL